MKKIVILWLVIFSLSGCGTFSAPLDVLSQGFAPLEKMFNPKTNSRYYERKARHLVNQLVDRMEDENSNDAIRKIAIMDLVDHNGRVAELGRYISLKITNEISKNNYFKLAPRGNLLDAMKSLNMDFDSFKTSIPKEFGEVLQVEAVISGKIIDLGTNLDVNVNSIDVKTGEIIASASESFARSDFATEMLRKY